MSTTKLLASGGLVMIGLAAQQAQAVLHISPAPGYSISWNGNDGDNFSVSNPALAPVNLARASSGSTPFANSQFGANHLTVKANDGNYGNTDSWIANAVDPNNPNPGIGVAFPALNNLTSVSWGRDNGNNTSEGQLTDRNIGLYTLQRTTVLSPNAATAVTGVAATGWENIGTLRYYGDTDTAVGGGFTGFLRHEYQIAFGGAAVPATGIRITAPNGIAIDEIEAYSGAVNTGLSLVSVTAPGVVPDNLALSSNGSVAFAKDLIGNGAFAPTHTIPNLNDGVYGNSNSWIGNSNPTFAGVALGQLSRIDQVAFGRDSDGSVSFLDRAAGIYIVQYTTAVNPNAATPDNLWTTIGSATLDTADPNRFIRHLYSFAPVLATGVRILTQNGEVPIAIDELEVFGSPVPEPASAGLLAMGAMGLLGMGRRRRA